MPIYLNGDKVKQSKFPGGECHVNIGSSSEYAIIVNLDALLENSDDIMFLLLTVDAIRRANRSMRICLSISYFPYARQDRVCNPGEALSVRVMADLINSLNLHEVIIGDPHSDVVGALINNCTVVPMYRIVKNFKELDSFIKDTDAYFVSPDAGAEKKVCKVVENYGCHEHVGARKSRNQKTGEIISIHLSKVPSSETAIIFDDICDGGSTFILLAKELKKVGAEKIYLYVTNGIFSNGLDELKKYIDRIYCYHVFDQNLIDNDFLIQDKRNPREN
jgi:ribose-phosphate pyrophosphokinase